MYRVLCFWLNGNVINDNEWYFRVFYITCTCRAGCFTLTSMHVDVPGSEENSCRRLLRLRKSSTVSLRHTEIQTLNQRLITSLNFVYFLYLNCIRKPVKWRMKLNPSGYTHELLEIKIPDSYFSRCTGPKVLHSQFQQVCVPSISD